MSPSLPWKQLKLVEYTFGYDWFDDKMQVVAAVYNDHSWSAFPQSTQPHVGKAASKEEAFKAVSLRLHALGFEW